MRIFPNQFPNRTVSLVHSVGILSMCNFFFEKSADWPKPVTRKIGQKNHKETDTTHIGETLATIYHCHMTFSVLNSNMKIPKSKQID